MRSVFIPPETNDGSAFMNHVALIWTVGDHTYAIGFHAYESLAATAGLNAALVRSVRLFAP